MDRVSVRAWEPATAEGIAECVTEEGGSMSASMFVASGGVHAQWRCVAQQHGGIEDGAVAMAEHAKS
ncbi:hypothetical protein GUJ93_ZPchr0012g20275 [Zizania palustris]|uniref:Uncharacterized protein n=1 Tax=Zizania palustris TaxID=103762 RepID=A0A8J5WPI9_ZIZPA|nr:hypothetical protein GUJ93_ZPchr0012g20275 [Zizania palustris]